MSEPRRYYIQDMPRTFRRYDPPEVWISTDRKWSPLCAPETCCWRTNDKRITEEEFKQAYPKIPL